jgi:hypothetical protein
LKQLVILRDAHQLGVPDTFGAGNLAHRSVSAMTWSARIHDKSADLRAAEDASTAPAKPAY